MSRELRVFRRLVRLIFPEDFRGGYETEMARTYGAQRREAGERGRLSVLRLWVETLADLGRTAPRQHLECLRQDLRDAGRQMAAQHASALAAVLVLAIGIASTTAVFSLVDAALLRPVPFDAPGRLVAIREQTPQDVAPWELSYTAVPGSPSRRPLVRADRRLPAERRAPRRTGPAVDRGDPGLAEPARDASRASGGRPQLQSG